MTLRQHTSTYTCTLSVFLLNFLITVVAGLVELKILKSHSFNNTRLPSDHMGGSPRDHPRMRALSYAWSLSLTLQNGGHTSRSTVHENPMLHANIAALCLIEQKLLPIEFLHCGNWIFDRFGSCDLDLHPMTFVYELDP